MNLLLDYKIYYDKVLAGWLGKSLGGIVGAPFENHKQYNRIAGDTLWPEILYPNDDLDIQVVWLEALQERGLYLDARQLAQVWRERCFYTCCEYGIFLYNHQRGIEPPLSGTWNNPFFHASEGCPIRSEIWGFICPGNPELAAAYAATDGCLDHGSVSIEIEQFLAAAEALCFVEPDLDRIFDRALGVLPSTSPVREVFDFVRATTAAYSEPYDVWRLLVRRYGHRDASNGCMNLAIVLAALALGKGDFVRTMELCVRFGWDADCTAATAGALLGALAGTATLPTEWLEKMGKTLICAVEIAHKHAPLAEFAAETCRLGVEMSLARNDRIRFAGAPTVEVRPAPAPQFTLTAVYPAEPVLWRERATSVQLELVNPTDRPLAGRLRLTCPAWLEADAGDFLFRLGPGERTVSAYRFRLRPGTEFVPDRNLIEAEAVDENGIRLAELVFGLGGARQYQAYGPYWDMWDKDKYDVCPYQNDRLRCNPANINVLDYFNGHVRFDHAYLDEARLLKEDLPEELPFDFETGEDLLTERNLGGFRGECCYYLVRTVRTPEEIPGVIFACGRSCPVKVWCDGKLLIEENSMTCWAPESDDRLRMDLGVGEHRIVVKLVIPADRFGFSLQLCGPGDPTRRTGISNLLDCLADRRTDWNRMPVVRKTCISGYGEVYSPVEDPFRPEWEDEREVIPAATVKFSEARP